MDNAQIAKILAEIGDYLEIKNEPFKPRAYQKAAEALVNFNQDVRQVYKSNGLVALKEIPGVGESIAEKIEELIKTGHLKYYDRLKKELPVNLAELTAIEGVGPKQIKLLYQHLKIKNLKQLEAAARAGKIRKLPHFGEKSEEKILKGIEFIKQSGGRFLLSEALSQAREIEDKLKQLKGVIKVVSAGSIRRRKETIGDLDFLLISKKRDAEKIMDFFVSMPEVINIYAKGPSKSLVRLKSGLDADLRIVTEKSFGAALHYFTGSKDHNIYFRELAIKNNWKLNEYGLFDNKKQIAGQSEAEIYKAFNMDYIEPELREMKGEVEAAKTHQLPKLIGYDDLRGDLQIQTNWSDGANSIEEMAEEAMRLGLEYILITDHSKRLTVANGLDEKRLLKQMAAIDDLNLKFKKQGLKFQILKGSECDILKDGSLDFPDKVLAKLDIVAGAVHSLFNLSEKEQTDRIKKAMSNVNVDIIVHPTGRVINRREPYKINIEELINQAKKTGTVLEIDAFPDRLDLKDDYIRKCVAAGVKMSISSDAHNIRHMVFLEYGIAQARRGWAKKSDIINAWPLEKMMSMLKNKHV